MMTDSGQPSEDVYRILVVDDETRVHKNIANQLSRLADSGKVLLYHAYNEDEAEQAFTDHYIDLLFLDLHLSGGDLGGYEVFNALEELGCSAQIILMTRLQVRKEDADKLVRLASRSDQPKVVEFIRKDEIEAVNAIVQDALADYDSRAIHLANLGLAGDILETRRDRYPASGPRSLRREPAEVCVELERLTRDLFARTERTTRNTTVSVTLRPLSRHGLSAAITLKPVVHIGFEDLDVSAPGYDCVLKIGPVDDIREEVARYQEYVRYGVQLEQRVELLAFAFRDALGGIVYSFAGGVYGQDLVSLDELLLEDDASMSQAAIQNWFSDNSWYSSSAGLQRIRIYVDQAYKQKLSTAIERNHASLVKLSSVFPEIRIEGGLDGKDLAVVLREAGRLVLPGTSFFGEGWSLEPYPWCLVHGDLHGGNVMVELSGGDDADKVPEGTQSPTGSEGSEGSVSRVCLIDYRNAGPGPRCIDGAAFEASIRLADAASIVRKIDANASSAKSLTHVDVWKAIQTAARRVDAERQLYQALWTTRSHVPSARWSRQSADMLGKLRENFVDDVSLEEYLQTVIYYGVRELAYKLDTVERVRICTWVAAAYAMFREMNPEPGFS